MRVRGVCALSAVLTNVPKAVSPDASEVIRGVSPSALDTVIGGLVGAVFAFVDSVVLMRVRGVCALSAVLTNVPNAMSPSASEVIRGVSPSA